MSDNPDTIDTIVDDMLNEGHTGPADSLEWIQAKMKFYAERIKAAWEREAVTGSHGLGNAAAMCEALAALVRVIDECDSGSPLWWHSGAKGVIPLKNAKDALAKPPRNCDVGTAAEQSRRFCAFCRPRTEPCDGCSCLEDAQHGRCEFIWAQMPYEEGGAE